MIKDILLMDVVTLQNMVFICICFQMMIYTYRNTWTTEIKKLRLDFDKMTSYSCLCSTYFRLD